MEPQCGKKRPFLAMEEKTPSTFPGAPKEHRRAVQVCKRNAYEGGNSALSGQRVSKPYFLCPQKRHIETTGDFRYVPTQQKHSVPVVQNDNLHTCSGQHISQCLYDDPRPVRGVLAHPNSEILSEVSNIRSGGGSIRLCGDAFRAEYCSQNIHKDVCSNYRISERKRGDGIWLSGRLARGCPNEIRLSKIHKDNPGNIGQGRLLSKLPKVLPHPSSDHPVAGMGVEDTKPDSLLPCRESQIPQSRRTAIPIETHVFPETVRKISRSPELGGTCGSLRQSASKIPECISTHSREKVSEGRTSPYEPEPKGPSSILVQHDHPRLDSAVHHTITHIHHHDRCVSDRLGVPHLHRSGGERSVEPFHEGTTYQCLRVHGSLDCHKKDEATKVNISHTPVRQRYRRELLEKGGICAFITSQQNDPLDHSISQEQGVVPYPSTCQGSVQCSRRSPLSRSSSLDGVGARPGLHTVVVTADVHQPHGGLIRDPLELQVPSVCVPNCNGRSHSSGCSQSRLESVEGGLPVSPISTDFSGFGSPISISRQGNYDSSEMAQTGLVSSSPPNVVQQVHATQSHSVPDSEWEYSLRSVLRNPESTRMDFLRLIYRKYSTPIVTDYLTSALRASTYNQYESVWRKFKAYVIETNPISINLNFVMSFLIFMFEGGGGGRL